MNALREMIDGRGAGDSRKVDRMVASVGAMVVYNFLQDGEDVLEVVDAVLAIV